MKKPHEPAVRALLRAHPDGLTVNEMLAALPQIGKRQTLVKILDQRMPDTYIDHWRTPIRGQWQAVWCVVTPPPHCPYPTDRFTPETRWRPL